jgi:hypothetical protein
MRIQQQLDGTYLVDGSQRFGSSEMAADYVSKTPQPAGVPTHFEGTPPSAVGSFLGIFALGLLALISFAIGQGTNGIAGLMTIVFFASSIALYFSPSWVAHRRGHTSAVAITVLNVLLGWTVLGWIGALVWAYSGRAKGQTHEIRQKWDEGSANRPTAPAPKAPSSDEKACPFCAETVKAAAIKCKHCGSDLLSNPTAT